MNQEVEVLLTTTFLLSLLGYFYYRMRTRFKVGLFAILLFCFSSIMSIVYYFQPLSNLNGNITWWPLFYWFAFFVITLIPLIQFDKSNVCKVTYNLSILNNIVKVGFYLSIIPFVEQFLQIPMLLSQMNSGGLGDVMVAAHDTGSLDNLSFISRNLLRVNIAIYDLCFLILLVHFMQPRKNTKMIFYLIVILLTRNLTGLIAGHRAAALELIFKMFIIALIATPLIGIKARKTMWKSIVWVFAGTFFVFAIITVGRAAFYGETKGDDFTLVYFLSWYAGEGLVNFNQFLPLMRHTTDGEICFWTILDLLGQQPHELTYEYYYGPLVKLQGIPQNIFYTYIGNFVQDLGFFGAGVWLVVMSASMTIITKIRGTVVPISKLFLVVFYANIIVRGVTSYCYDGEHGKFIFLSFILYIYLKAKKM